MRTEQAENLDTILRQSAFPADTDVSELRRLLAELTSAQPLPADVTVTAAALGSVPTAEITIDGTEPSHVVLYFHGGVYVLGDAFQAAGLASQIGRRTRATVPARRSSCPRTPTSLWPGRPWTPRPRPTRCSAGKTSKPGSPTTPPDTTPPSA